MKIYVTSTRHLCSYCYCSPTS